MNKKIFLMSLVALAIIAAVSAWKFLGKETNDKATYNLFLITLDTMRADRLGCYGDSKAQTPAIDELAKEGVLFENCYSPVPITLPAHCSIMTGRWSVAHGVRNNAFYSLTAAEMTLAETLAGTGYENTALVAAYVLKKKFGLDQGFSSYNDDLGLYSREGGIEAQISAACVYEKFTTWMKRHSDGAPFFLWVHLYDPHKPYAPPPEFLKAANGDAYRGEVACADHAIGRMIADLRERGLLERTLVVVVGDHGEAFGEHVEEGHGIFCYEESIRVPLIFCGPGVAKKALRVNPRACLIDVMPTVLELLRIPAPATCQGESLAMLLSGRAKKAPRSIYLESLYGQELSNWAPLTALIKENWKYVSLPQAELYDLNADPGEKNNLFFSHNAEARRLDRELAAFIASPQNHPTGGKRTLEADDKKKLEALGYISSFATSGQVGLDPKIGIVYQERCAELFAAFDRGEIAHVEAEALRFKEETAEFKFPFIYSLLHYVYAKKQQWDKVEANLIQACEVFRDKPKERSTFQSNLLEFYFASKNFRTAEKLATEMIGADSQQTRPLEILGEIAKIQKKWQQALDWFLRALQAEGDDYSLRKKVVEMRLKLRDTQGAREEIGILLTNRDGIKDPDLLFTAAMLFVDNGDNARAETLLARLVEIEPTALHWFDYSLLLARAGKIDQAIAGMNKALAVPTGQLDDERRQAALRALRVWKEKRSR